MREPVLRNAAAAGSHPDVCAPPPLSGVPELPGPVGLVVGLAGAAGLVGVAGVVTGLGFDELPDLPGPFPLPLPLSVWLFGFGWFVEPLFWLPALLEPWFPWLPFVGWSVGLPGDGVGLPGDGVGLTGEGVGLPVCVGGPMRSTQ